MEITRPTGLENNKTIPSTLSFPVVGMGASAGGLPALQRFFENMPPATGMAFIVILHLPSKSNAAEVLQAATQMPVRQVVGTARIEQNHVYLIPPNKYLSMHDGRLQIEDINSHSASKRHVPIDLFFRSLAEVHRERAVGIVLSGTGADGAVGLARIKELGGITMAQRPDDAEHEGMPSAAIEAGTVDVVLPVIEMPQRLVALWSNAQKLELPPSEDPDAPATAPSVHSTKEAEEALQEIIGLLRTYTGHDFRHYKRATVIRRIERRLQVRGLPNLPAYRDRLKEDADEGGALLNDFWIGVTNFFRDHEAFDALERNVLPSIFVNKRVDEHVRAWVAGCSTGEEAYSIAMLLSDQAAAYPKPPSVQIFATDVDQRAIAVSRAGVYPESIAADIPPVRLRQYFVKEDRHLRIKKSLRERVLFAAHDLLKDPPFSKVDLISCRNLLIYLTQDVQSQLLDMFHFALNPGGYLFLGSSESADAVGQLFTAVDKKHGIYQTKATTRYARTLRTNAGAHRHMREPEKDNNRHKFSFADVHHRALARYAPPSLIINAESNIVHMSQGVGRFLRYVEGEPSRNVVALVVPELRLELRTALFQAIHKGRSIEARRVQVKREGRVFWVNIVARPFRDDEADADFVLLLFNEFEESMSGEEADSKGGRKDTVMAQLEEELQRTKEQLQDTIEHSDTSTEKLKSSNEELQAINAELRLVTEELKTSKEELQSVNQELVTVNHELNAKVEETKKVNDDLHNLIASADIATIFVDQGMHIKRYTPRASDIFNIIPSDIGRSLLDITHSLEYDKLADDAATAFESLRLVERQVRNNDGRYYIARMLPYRTNDNRIEGAVLTFIDITSRRTAEEKLRVGEARMRLVAESTKDYAIITCDPTGIINSWNKGAERIFGYTEEEALGRMIDMIFQPEDIQKGVPEAERKCAREEGRAEDERWHVRKDGTRLYCSGIMTPLRDGEFDGYVKIARELTERKQRERQREAQLAKEKAGRKDAQAENMLKDQFLAIMSHELKQPLNLIHINAEILARLPELRHSASGSKAAATIQRSVISQAKIIDDLLDLSRLSTGKLALAPSEVDLAASVKAILDVIQSTVTANELTVSGPSANSPVMVRADPVRLEQIIWNLVSNALKFTPAGGSIAVNIEQEEKFARLDVTDTGQGITPEFLPHIFDIFRQAASPTTRAKGGLGIGMSLVKQLTTLHGGRVRAQSAGPGKGASFSVWLPLYDASAAADVAEYEEAAKKSGVAGLTILLVDDMEEPVIALKTLLESEGATVIPATDAQSAMQRLIENHVDVILSDIALPDVDGYEFIRTVRTHPEYANVPAIAVTGMGRPKDVKQAMQAGFSAHMSKPVVLDVLIDAIARQIS